MKKEDLFDCFSEIDEKKIISAGNMNAGSKRHIWLKLGASAAVLCAAFALVVMTLPKNISNNPPIVDVPDGSNISNNSNISNIGEYSGPVTEEKMNGAKEETKNGALEESGRWMYASDVTENDSGVHGVAIPSFIAYDGALYGGSDFEALSGEYLATDGKVMFNSKYEFNAYNVKDNENLVGIVINGGVMIYEKLYSFTFKLEDEIYGLKYTAKIGTDYSLGEVILETDDFTVYRAIRLGDDEMVYGEYIVDISKFLVRQFPNAFNENENHGEFRWIATPLEKLEDASVDVDGVAEGVDGVYVEAVNLDTLKKELADVYCGSYIDGNGKLNVVLTADTPEIRSAVCEELCVSENVTMFVKGKYTLVYLTNLQEKISTAMANGEFPFVVTSGVYETINRIVVGVTNDSEDNIKKLMALDEIGGAIVVEVLGSAFTEELLSTVN